MLHYVLQENYLTLYYVTLCIAGELSNIVLCYIVYCRRTNCSWCILDENECAWCEETQTCFPFMGYILRHNYGGCTHWVDSMSEQRCHDCSRYSTCHGCVQEYLCGWCGNVEDPTYGVCLHGDFTGRSEISDLRSIARASIVLHWNMCPC